MKMTKKKLKELIKEEITFLSEDKEDKVDVDDYTDPYTDYEEEDLDTDKQMIALLQEIVSQLKVLNLSTTQAQDYASSAAEKARASISVAETEEK